MALVFEVIEGHNKKSFAVLDPKRGIKYRKYYYVPTNMEIYHSDGSKNAAGTLGMAALGGIALGGAGAVVGALAGGNKGKTAVFIECTDGTKLVGLVKTQHIPGMYVEVENLKKSNIEAGPAFTTTAEKIAIACLIGLVFLFVVALI